MPLNSNEREDDSNWPAPDKIGRQELEIKLGNTHISFTVHFLHLIQDLEAMLSVRSVKQ